MKKLVVLGCFLSACGPVTATITTHPEPSPTPQSCTVSPVYDGQQITCPDGTTGIVYNGQPGSNGLSAATVTTIQFCPNVTTIYPNSFPEYGIVINGAVYAVYSANGGFLTLLAPGWYYSNAIGSDCNFEVNTNGTISW